MIRAVYGHQNEYGDHADRHRTDDERHVEIVSQIVDQEKGDQIHYDRTVQVDRNE